MNGLEKEYQGALKCDVRNATTPENIEQIRAYGFDTHGMVIFDAQGHVKKKMNGHFLQEPEIRAAVREVIEGS